MQSGLAVVAPPWQGKPPCHPARPRPLRSIAHDPARLLNHSFQLLLRQSMCGKRFIRRRPCRRCCRGRSCCERRWRKRCSHIGRPLVIGRLLSRNPDRFALRQPFRVLLYLFDLPLSQPPEVFIPFRGLGNKFKVMRIGAWLLHVVQRSTSENGARAPSLSRRSGHNGYTLTSQRH